MRDIAHCHLNFLALLAEFLARGADHDGNQRQDREHDQRQLPVHHQQIDEQEHHGQAFADHHLDGIGRSAGHHCDVEGDARDQMTGIGRVEVTIGQHQQLVEQLDPQVMHQPQGNLSQEIVAQKGTQPLPCGDQHDKQWHGLQQLQLAQIRDIGKQHRFGIGQAIDEIFQDAGEHRLGRSEDHETNDAEQENAHIRTHIRQQAEIDFHAGGCGRFGGCHENPSC